MLNMNQLRAFYEVIKAGGFARAARRLNVTQPAVTAQVRSLEELCGFKLIVRKGKTIYPTEEGKLIFQSVKNVFKAVDDSVSKNKENLSHLSSRL